MIPFLRRLFGKRASADLPIVILSETHDYTLRRFGHDLAVTSTEESGQIIKASGWGPSSGPKMVAGDFVILPNGSETTRYRIIGIRYYADPPDQWHATLTFAPRTS